jgi:ectoine hydroxylase-related dioxygenase (phytanoyl-CoA dioxygenase family)
MNSYHLVSEPKSPEHVQFYDQHGYLRLPGIFTADEVEELRSELSFLIENFATRSPGWSGPWRRAYMDEETERRSELVAMHDLQLFSEAWLRAVTKPALCRKVAELLNGPVELHHSTLHVKPPETGHPFPLHQDWAFYQHRDARYVDAIIHLDDTCHENGELRFLDGSHRAGALPHVTQADGRECTPHLPTDDYRLTETVPVPARAGDVVCFSIHSVHGSYLNRTSALRRLVRVGYRHPDNEQLAGQSHGRPGLLVWGRRNFRNRL